METCTCEDKRICVDLYEEDYKKLQHMKVYYGLQVHDLLHMIVSEIYSQVDLYDEGEEAQTASVTVTYHFGRKPKTYSEIEPTESGYHDEATHNVSQYDYTYYPDEVKEDPAGAKSESGRKNGQKEGQ